MRTRWFWLGCVVLSGCTYGPEQERSRIVDVARRPESRTFVAAVRYERFRPPTGWSTFPNGGTPRMLEQAALLYVVDVGRDTIIRVERMQAPAELATTFNVHVDGWNGDRWYFTLSGCPGRECYGDLRRFRQFEVAPGAPPARFTSHPLELDRPPGMLARAPGEAVYMRVSHGWRLVRIRTEDDGPFVVRYAVEPSGALVRASSADGPGASAVKPDGRARAAQPPSPAARSDSARG